MAKLIGGEHSIVVATESMTESVLAKLQASPLVVRYRPDNPTVSTMLR